MWEILGFGLVAAIVIALVFAFSKSKKCPRCGTRLPMIRKPQSVQEGLWGGWTCTNCGCKVDRYGKERVD